jgi:hypothetical protein
MKCPPVKEKIKIEEWNIRVLITHWVHSAKMGSNKVIEIITNETRYGYKFFLRFLGDYFP